MNKGYIYVDGTLIIEDEKFKKTIIDYTDNFEEELNDKKNVVWPTMGIKISKIDDKKLLENLKKQLEFHYNLGYNSQKYYKYLENGILEEKLKDKNYTEEEIKCVSEYLKEKGPILSRRK